VEGHADLNPLFRSVPRQSVRGLLETKDGVVARLSQCRAWSDASVLEGVTP
jgi:hypothetical protein